MQTAAFFLLFWLQPAESTLRICAENSEADMASAREASGTVQEATIATFASHQHQPPTTHRLIALSEQKCPDAWHCNCFNGDRHLLALSSPVLVCSSPLSVCLWEAAGKLSTYTLLVAGVLQ